MQILIHCNAGARLGAGHAIRSIALAEQAAQAGHDVTFVGALEGEFIRRQLADLGVGVLDLGPSEVDHALEVAVRARQPEVVHLDSYTTGLRLSPADAGCLVSRVADGTFGQGRADVVVDPTLGAELDAGPGDGAPVQLRGSRYTPLRRRVSERRGAWRGSPQGRMVLVVMGGTDAHGLTPQVLELLGATDLGLEVTAVVGAGGRTASEAAAARHPAMSVSLVEPVDHLPALMTQADLVVSAAGTSVWELCCLGVPMAVVQAADNQRPGYGGVVAAGAAIGLGTPDKLDDARGVAALRRALTDDDVRQQLSARARPLVDGLGAWRIVATWEQLLAGPPVPQPQPPPGWALRRASMADAPNLLKWRNDPATRSVSRSTDEIDEREHVAWLGSALTREDRMLLVAQDGSGPVGTLRWDRVDGREWEVSITLAPERRGEGLARVLLETGETSLAQAVGGPVRCLATVLESNTASRRLFTGAGYTPDRPVDEDGFAGYAKLRPGPR